MRRRIALPLVFTALLTGLASATPGTRGINPATYPSLSEKQMGHTRHLINLANQLDGDWSMMGNTPGGDSFDAYQFQIAFAAYTLGLVQYHLVPAHRDLYREASDALIQKMLYRDVWQYWARMSQSEWTGADAAGSRSEYTEANWHGWIDPNISKNIMYSGHLLQMVSLHESLYGDRKYDAPGSLPFLFPSIEFGSEPLRMEYNHDRLIEVINEQFMADDYVGIECERGAIYTECNQHPILGIMLYDQVHETDIASDIQRGFAQTIQERQYISDETHTTMNYWDVRADRVVPATYAWSDGWNGHAHHVWAKDLVESLYLEQVKLYVPSMLQGNPLENMGWTASFDFGWFGILASEVGDSETVQLMLDYADEHFVPTWSNGGLYYPYTPDYRVNFLRDPDGFIANISPVTGNVLIGYMRINPKDGGWELYNNPRTTRDLAAPFVSGVDFLHANVTQAVYDHDVGALVVTIAPGPVEAATAVTFTVNQLDPSMSYSIVKDGSGLGRVARPTSEVSDAHWASDGSLSISTTLGEPHTFVIVADR